MALSAKPLSLADLPPAVWQAHALATPIVQVQPTGDAPLDAQLPGGGWPIGSMTEILQPDAVHAEWRLLLPALARSGQGSVVLVGAPHVPFAPALAAMGLQTSRLLWVNTSVMSERLWAAEQALTCAQVDAVLLWLNTRTEGMSAARNDQLRRLHLGASEHAKLFFVMRPLQARTQASPASLRLELTLQSQSQPQVQSQSEGQAQSQASGASVPQSEFRSDVHVHLLKRRGPPTERSLALRASSGALQCLLATQSLLGTPSQRTTPPLAPPPAREHHALDCTARAA